MRAKEFVSNEKVDEALPAIGAAVARGAATLGSAAKAVGAQTLSNKLSPQQQQAVQQALPEPGQMYNHPRFGPVKVLPLGPGQKGLHLDTSKALGHSILIGPDEISLS